MHICMTYFVTSSSKNRVSSLYLQKQHAIHHPSQPHTDPSTVPPCSFRPTNVPKTSHTHTRPTRALPPVLSPVRLAAALEDHQRGQGLLGRPGHLPCQPAELASEGDRVDVPSPAWTNGTKGHGTQQPWGGGS